MIMIMYFIGCLLSAILIFLFYWKYAKEYKTCDIPITIIFIGLSWLSILIEITVIGCILFDYINKHWTKVLWRSKK